jgi:hypothetical protein
MDRSETMSKTINQEVFTKALYSLLEETFEKVAGVYLDGGTSFFESLAALNGAAASRPITPEGTTVAAQVRHVRFYIQVLNDYMDGQWHEKVDWKGSWFPAAATDGEWTTLRAQLEDDYRKLLDRFKGIEDWNAERQIGGALAIVVHTAYHLGAIRQILRVVKP